MSRSGASSSPRSCGGNSRPCGLGRGCGWPVQPAGATRHHRAAGSRCDRPATRLAHRRSPGSALAPLACGLLVASACAPAMPGWSSLRRSGCDRARRRSAARARARARGSAGRSPPLPSRFPPSPHSRCTGSAPWPRPCCDRAARARGRDRPRSRRPCARAASSSRWSGCAAREARSTRSPAS